MIEKDSFSLSITNNSPFQMALGSAGTLVQIVHQRSHLCSVKGAKSYKNRPAQISAPGTGFSGGLVMKRVALIEPLTEWHIRVDHTA